MNNLKIIDEIQIHKIVAYFLLAYLSYSFLVHGLSALSANPGYIILMTELGLSYAVSKVLILIIGVFDVSVAIALFAYRKKFVVLYASVWPIFVMLGKFVSSGQLYLSYLQYFIVGITAYMLFFHYKSIVNFSKEKLYLIKYLE